MNNYIMTTYTWIPDSGLHEWNVNDNWVLGSYPNDFDAIVRLNPNSIENQTIDVNALINLNKLIIPECSYEYLLDRMLLTFGGTDAKIEKLGANNFRTTSIICLNNDLEIYTDLNSIVYIDGQFSNQKNITLTGFGKVIFTNNNSYDKTYVGANVTLQISDYTDRGTAGNGDIYNDGTINVTTKGVTQLPNTIHGSGVVTYDPGL